MKKSIRKILVCFLIVLPIFSPVANVYAVESAPILNATSILAYTNAQRYKEHIPLLSTNALLSDVARKKMIDLFARQYFAHESPTGDSVSDLAHDAGYEYIVVGENLALGDFGSSKAVVDAWMNSPGHKKNILSKSYSEIGIAVGRSMYKGRYTWIAVQSFGFPKSGCPNVDPVLKKSIDSLKNRLDIYEDIALMRKEQIERAGITLEEKKMRVDSYNVVVDLYNEAVEEYRNLVAQYNEEVGEFNKCLTTTFGSTKSA
ncbi:TPA: hypothetical protein DEP58_03410 [Patescibacteria group bacterium]|nr:MAG: SCP-like protein extracellular protein [Parcubacteria group bacterium GW2011_GWD2_42_14]HCC05328.1 hypothetical protein [Patescibacteria group bacterium]